MPADHFVAVFGLPAIVSDLRDPVGEPVRIWPDRTRDPRPAATAKTFEGSLFK